MTLSGQDWSAAGDFAWLYALLVGWTGKDGEPRPDLGERFGWPADRVDRLRRLRGAIAAVTDPDPTVAAVVAGRAEHHDLTKANVGDSVIAELTDLHARAREFWAAPLDVAAVLRTETQALRVRFVGGGRGSSMLDCDQVDAIVHAAEHGYTLCKEVVNRRRCWLPEVHAGGCCSDLWRWRLLYGQPENDPAVTVVCSSCTPHQWLPRPASCTHGRV